MGVGCVTYDNYGANQRRCRISMRAGGQDGPVTRCVLPGDFGSPVSTHDTGKMQDTPRTRREKRVK